MMHALRGSLGALLLLFSATASAEEGPAISVNRLTGHLYQLTTDQGAYTTNTLASVGEDGVLLVDTQSPDDAAALKEAVEAFGKGSPRFIINTHCHLEHVGGNAIFGEAPIVIGHDRLRQKLTSGSYLFDEFGPATLPDITVTDSLSLYFNGERIDVTDFAGSHDDTEVIVHFTGSGVVHLSSIVNGFNLPGVDADGDALNFAELVQRAMELLPEDVVIVSGHNENGSWKDLHAYHDMLVGTTEAVRKGLAAGKDAAALKDEKALARWEPYAGSYVSIDAWTDTLVAALAGKERKKSVYEPLYFALKDHGVDAAVALYKKLKRDHPDDYGFDEPVLPVIGMKLLKRDRLEPAVRFLQLGLEEAPEAPWAYYAYYQLAQAHEKLGERDAAIGDCEKALALQPESQPVADFLEQLKKES
jgi:glyoxylase-like metal-dependent hydrolase (beta-lactamase superfamily II)